MVLLLKEDECKFALADILIGTYMSGGNHWTLVMIDLKKQLFSFIDPKNDMDRDYKLCEKYCRNWTIFCKVWKRVYLQDQAAYCFGSKVFAHDWQGDKDSNNCAIDTLLVRHKHPKIQLVNHLLLFIARSSLFVFFRIYFSLQSVS